MGRNNFRVMDVELHLEEPLDLWERNLPEPYRSETKVISTTAHGQRVAGGKYFVVARNVIPNPRKQRGGGESRVLQQSIRRLVESTDEADRHLAYARTHCEPQVYLEGMDIAGIDVGGLMPTMGMQIIRHDDIPPDHALALCQVTNNYAREFTQANPERLKFWGSIPPHDISLAVQEARRCVRELGAVGVYIFPQAINGHIFSDAYFEPLWAELETLGVPIGFHGGSGTYPAWNS